MTKAKLTIRTATEGDYQQLESITRRLYDLDQKGVPGVFVPKPKTVMSRGDFLNILEDKKAIYLIAEDNGTYAGQLYMWLSDEDGDNWAKLKDANIGELYIEPDYRRQGVATELVAKAEAWARRQKADRLITIYYDYAKEAAGLYTELGFRTRSIKAEKILSK